MYNVWARFIVVLFNYTGPMRAHSPNLFRAAVDGNFIKENSFWGLGARFTSKIQTKQLGGSSHAFKSQSLKGIKAIIHKSVKSSISFSCPISTNQYVKIQRGKLSSNSFWCDCVS